MKTKAKVVAVILLLVGITACGFAVKKYIVYQDSLAISGRGDYAAEREMRQLPGQSGGNDASRQRAMDAQRNADNEHELALKARTQAVLGLSIGAGLIVASVLLLVLGRRISSAGMSAYNG